MISNQEDDQRTKSRNKDNEDSAMSSSVDPGAVERQMIQDDKHAGSLAFRVNEDGPPSEDKEQAEEQLKPPAKSVSALKLNVDIPQLFIHSSLSLSLFSVEIRRLTLVEFPQAKELCY